MISQKHFVSLTLSLLIGILAFAQNKIKADSIKNEIAKGILSPSQEMEAYYRLPTHTIAPDEKLEYAEYLLELAEEANSLEYRIKAYMQIGIAHRFMGNLERALEYLFKSADEAAGKQQFKLFLAEVYGEISTCYTQNGDSENALYYGSKTIELLRGSGRRQTLALSLLNYGYDYYLKGNYDSAMAYYNESEPILKAIGMDLGIAYIIGNRALVFWKLGAIEKGKEDLFRAIEMLKPMGDKYGMADYYNQLGNIYKEENNDEEAIRHTMIGLELAKEIGLKEQVRDASNLLFQLHLKKGNLTEAIEYQTQYYAYKDSIQNLETTQRLGDLRTEYEVGRKQAEVDLLLEQKRNNRIIMITGGVLLLAFICLVVIVYSYFKAKNRLSIQLEKQKDDLVVLNHTKDKFFSIISHDLRGPVNTLNGLVTVSQLYLKEGKGDQVKGMVNKMSESVDRLTKLLDTLLNWALQQRGHFPYVPERLDLGEMAKDVIEMFRDTAMSKSIQLEFEADEAYHLMVDKNTTSTILRNLINNAIKFTNTGGQVKITAKADPDNRNCTITITDNGVGIPREKLDGLFTLDETISTKGTLGETGLGLGLQLVYEFVSLNKGKIEAKSEQGKGTTFTISLPLASA
ncbi:tetratricopeptide repeat-containing sensor histidine kinase [Ekhidna sp.]|uniref:tetratricopeptide repeat-containing sensor histidine kinase n=1 Tax=Ekhidna sp. TaxID=2608089 RepID=UPI00329A6D98